MRLDGRLGGHLVQGHVDGTGAIVAARAVASTGRSCASRCRADLARYVVRQGLDHRRRRLADRRRRSATGSFTVSLIPTTLALTTLGRKQVGDPVNLEVDVVAKYVERLLAPPRDRPRRTPHERRSPTCTRPTSPSAATTSPGGRSSATRSGWRPRSAACAARSGPGRSASSATSCCSPSSSFTATESDHGGSPLFGQAGRQVFFIIVSRLRLVALVAERSAAAPARRRSCRAGPPAARAGRLPRGRPRSGSWSATCVFRAIGAGFPAEWWFYLADAWIFVGSIVATYAMARGWVDFWLCWIAVDLVGVPLLLHSHFYPLGRALRRLRGVRDLGLRHLAEGGADRGRRHRRRAPEPDEVPA